MSTIELMLAAANVQLTSAELEQLASTSSLIDTTASRYPEKMQKMIDR